MSISEDLLEAQTKNTVDEVISTAIKRLEQEKQQEQQQFIKEQQQLLNLDPLDINDDKQSSLDSVTEEFEKACLEEYQEDYRKIDLVKKLYQNDSENVTSLIDSVNLITEMDQISMQRRKIDERTSLLTEKYLPDKYPEDNIHSGSIYQPPVISITDISTTNQTETTKVVTGNDDKQQSKVQTDSDSKSKKNINQQIKVEEGKSKEQQQESSATQSKKKKRKNNNKKKKNKNKQQQLANQDVQTQEVPSTTIIRDQLEVIQSEQSASDQNTPQRILESTRVDYNLHNMTIQQEEDGLESISLDQIEIKLANSQNISRQGSTDYTENVTQDQSLKKKQNNFINPIMEVTSTPVQVLTSTSSDIIDQPDSQIQDEEEETKSLALDITAGICNQVIFSVQDNSQNHQEEKQIEIIESYKNKNKKDLAKQKQQNKQVSNQNNSANSKKNKKSNKNQQKQAQPQKQTQLQTQIQKEQLNKTTPIKIELASPQQLQRERLDKLQQDGLVLLHSTSPRSKSTKKHVEFKIPGDDNSEGEIRIPKRGSSRGSSVGTEEVYHQHMIKDLGELFPTQYKNPSDDTKTKIIELTNSSENSVSPIKPSKNEINKSKTVQIQNQKQNINQESNSYQSSQTQKIYAKKQVQSQSNQNDSNNFRGQGWNQQTDYLMNQNRNKKHPYQQQQQLVYQAKESSQTKNQAQRLQQQQLIQAQQNEKQKEVQQDQKPQLQSQHPSIQNEKTIKSEVTQQQVKEELKVHSPQSSTLKYQQKPKKDKKQITAAQQKQLNFDSYEAMFQTAYNNQIQLDNYYVPKLSNSSRKQQDEIGMADLQQITNSQELSIVNAKEEQKLEEQKEQDQVIIVKQEVVTVEIQEKQDQQTQQIIKSQSITLQQEIIEQDYTQQYQVANPEQKTPTSNQPIINLKKPSKKQQRQEIRDLREQGASVNPDILQNLTKKQQQQQQRELIQANIQQTTNPSTSNTQKKIKPKAVKPNAQNQTQQNGLNVAPIEQRSQTPNIDMSSEPLVSKNSQNKKYQQQNQKQQNKNNQKKKTQQVNQINQNLNFPLTEQFIQYDQQQQQQYLNQNFLRLQQQQLQMNNAGFMGMQNPLLFQPNMNQQLLFNNMLQGNQPFMQPLLQTPLSPLQMSQQYIIPKLQNTQETQTDSQNQADLKDQVKQMSSPTPIDIASQTNQFNQQQQNIQTMINQISNINIQVYQMPTLQGQNFNMFSPLAQDPYLMQQQLNPFMFQNQLLNPQLNPLYQQNQLFMQGLNNQMLIPPNTFSPQTQFNNQFNAQANLLQFNQPFNNFQLQQQQQQQQTALANQHRQSHTQQYNVSQVKSPNQDSNNYNNHHSQHKYPTHQSQSQVFNSPTNPFNLQTNQNQFMNMNLGSNNNSSHQYMSQHMNSMNMQSFGSQLMGGFHTDRQVTHQTLDQYQAQTREELFYQKFDREIYKLMIKQQIKLQKTEYERQLAFRYIEQYVKQAYQGKINKIMQANCIEYVNVKVQMYGSMATGLAIDSSDMDVLVSGVFSSEVGLVDKILLVEQMRILHKQLDQLYCLESNSIIETATVPVIKIVLDLQKIREANSQSTLSDQVIDEDMKHLKIDITFNEQENDQYMMSMGFAQPVHMGIKCCHFIKQKLQEYPQLQSLTLLLKKFLAIRDLNSPYQGGLSSYGLILLIIAFINQDLPQIYDPVTDQLSPARILTQFLFYYGRIFDVKLSMINEYQQIVPPQILSFQQILMIVDPLNPQNNIGKSTYNFDMIRDEFSRAYDSITKLYTQFIGSEKENKKGASQDSATHGSSDIQNKGSDQPHEEQKECLMDEKDLNILKSVLYVDITDIEDDQSSKIQIISEDN